MIDAFDQLPRLVALIHVVTLVFSRFDRRHIVRQLPSSEWIDFEVRPRYDEI